MNIYYSKSITETVDVSSLIEGNIVVITSNSGEVMTAQLSRPSDGEYLGILWSTTVYMNDGLRVLHHTYYSYPLKAIKDIRFIDKK